MALAEAMDLMSATNVPQMQQFRRMRRIATGLLLAMVAVYIAVRSLDFGDAKWPGYVRAFAEAAMIGALADWFAVVALFRHPMGIPFPHTAVIPRNKDRIGSSLGRFIAQHFLTPEVVRPRLEQLDLTGVVGEWLKHNSSRIADQIGEQLPRAIELVDDEAVFRFLHEQLVARLSAIDMAPLLGRVIEVLTESDRHKELLREGLGIVDRWLTRERDWLRTQIRREIRLPDWPGVIGIKDKLADYAADRVVEKVSSFVHEVSTDPQHSFHARFRRTVDEQIVALRESPAYRARAEEFKRQLLEHPAVGQYARDVWRSTEAWIAGDLAQQDSKLRQHIQHLASGTGTALAENPELRARLNAWVQDAAGRLVVAYRYEVENIIRDTIGKWEADDVCANLEREVGRDLQFIRINGTLVGGAVGVIIHVISQTVWGG